MELLENRRCAGGWQKVFTHDSEQTGTAMRFAVFEPDGPTRGVLMFLSGLTCTEQNVITKGHFQAAAADAGVVVLCPDTSPRGEGVPDVPEYDFGVGAGFYLDATQAPWSEHFRMRSYLMKELLPHVTAQYAGPVGITGHSMGGHGALVLGLTYPDRFATVSALAPIASAPNCPWGEKALAGYLGEDRATWEAHDAAKLLASGYDRPVLVDQGEGDDFLAPQLKPHLLRAAADQAGVDLTLRMQPGYDHSYYFISTFLGEHLRWHAARW